MCAYVVQCILAAIPVTGVVVLCVFLLLRVTPGDPAAVTHLMAQRLEPTLALTCTTRVFAVALAVPLGVLAAWKAAPGWIGR